MEELSVIASSCNLSSSSLAELSDMLSAFECGVAESDDVELNPFLIPCYDDIDSILAEQNEIKKEVKLSCLMQLDDKFTTEDQWPI